MAAAVGEGEVLHGIDVLRLDGAGATPGGMGTGGAQPDQVRAQTVDAGGVAALGDALQRGVAQGDRSQLLARVSAALLQRQLRALPVRQERLRIGIEGQAAADDLGALSRRGHAFQLHLEAEAVQQLRA